MEDGLSILQYANDTILFIDHDLEQAKNMKLLLSVFEQLSGLKINFHKSEIEVEEAVFQMERNKSPSLDGFSVEFYQVF